MSRAKEESQTNGPLRVSLVSLGCAKNLVDSELMVGTLLKDGLEITNDSAGADVVIVNTCSFIDSAQEESIDAILQAAQWRESRKAEQALIVAGCLPQRFRGELPKLLPEVDAFMGIDQAPKVTEIVKQAVARRISPKSKGRTLKSTEHSPSRIAHQPFSAPNQTEAAAGAAERNLQSAPPFEVNPRPTYIPDYATPRFRLTPRHFAYVKIAEGCNHPCSFCIIPRMRGSHRSRPQADVIAEACGLIAEGVKELNLISQDSTYYGLDLRPNHSRAISAPGPFRAAVQALPVQATTICSLLRELNALPGEFWIRLLYTHPAHWTDELIRTIAECPKVARYVDIPLQHIHENMLERMRRETSQEYIIDLVRRIRAGIPGIALRTTFIVGFPGETDEYFQALLDFIRQTRFERLGVFTYSQQEGTRAGNMAGQIPERVKRKRRDLAMAAQHQMAAQVARSFVGRTIKVLVENEASAKELKNARIQSWEHGLLRARNGDAHDLRGNYLVARGEADAPDIDGRVYIVVQGPKSKVQSPQTKVHRNHPTDLKPGEFHRVNIIGHTDYDLIAEPA